MNEAIYLVRILNSTSKQRQSHSSSPLVTDLSDQMVKTSGIRASEHQASNTVCPGDVERRERGEGGGGKEGEDGWLATVKWDRGAVSKADPVWLSQMRQRIVLVPRQTDLGAKHPITCCSRPNTNPAAVESNPSIHSGNIGI